MEATKITGSPEFDHVYAAEIKQLLDKLPSQSWHKGRFQFENGQWCFQFECNHVGGRFEAFAFGDTPLEAFARTRQLIFNQVSEWHKTRFATVPEPLTQDPSSTPSILIVDDDIDLALGLQLAIDKLGYNTEVATKYQDLHRKIADCEVDFIFLDWNLNDGVTGGQVVDKASRLINTFSDLRRKFSRQPPRIITYSVLSREQVELPWLGTKYFTHLDHWQKPLPFHEVVERTADLLKAA